MDHFKQMEIFRRVAKVESFTAVANQLGHSPAAVARHVNSLEAHLGVRLLNRSTRSLSLTEAGRAYAELCERVLDEVAACESNLSVSEKTPRGSIRMAVPKSFGSMQLGDAVIEFSVKNPDISMMIMLEDFSPSPLDFVEKGFDLALRWGIDLRDSTLVATQLGTEIRKLCAAPSYIEAHGTPSTIEEVKDHNCLIHTIAYSDQIWRFHDGDKEVGIKVSGDFASDSALMLRKAAVAGRGVSVLPYYAIQEDLEAGKLIELLPEHPCPANPLLLIYKEKRLLPSRVRMFIDFLRDWFIKQGLIAT